MMIAEQEFDEFVDDARNGEDFRQYEHYPKYRGEGEITISHKSHSDRVSHGDWYSYDETLDVFIPHDLSLRVLKFPVEPTAKSEPVGYHNLTTDDL